MSASGSVPARFPRTYEGSYAGSVVIVGDGQIELIVEPGGPVVLEAQEVKDLVRLLAAARRTAVEQMIDTHAQITGHVHGWARVADHAFVGRLVTPAPGVTFTPYITDYCVRCGRIDKAHVLHGRHGKVRP